jgi:hypothetical protein
MTSSVLQSGRHRVLIATLMIASLLPIWSVAYFPSQNGPWSLLIAKMLSDYSNPVFNYSAYYEQSWHAIPHMLHTLVVYALSFVVPVLVAHKIAISVFVVLFPLSVFVLLSAVDPRRSLLGYASFLFVYNVPLLRGYHDYSIGLPIVMLTFAYWWKRRDALTTRARLVIMAMTVPIYFSHIFNLAVLGLSMVLTTAWERRRVRPVLTVASLFAIPSVLTLEYAWFTATHAEWINRNERVFLTPPAAAEAFFNRFFNTLSFPAYIITLAALLGWSFLVLTGLVTAWRQWRARPTEARAALALPVLLAVLTVFYFAMPYKFLNWHYANVRFIPYVLVFALACASPLGPVTGRLFVGSMATAALLCFGLMTREFMRANDTIEEFVSGVAVVEMNKTLLPLNFEEDQIGEIWPVAHAADYYQLYRGGANGRGMAQFNTLTPLVYRAYPVRQQFPSLKSGPNQSLEDVIRAYDYVLLWDDPGSTTRQLTEGGFQLAYRQGRLRILRNPTRVPAHPVAIAASEEGPS